MVIFMGIYGRTDSHYPNVKHNNISTQNFKLVNPPKIVKLLRIIINNLLGFLDLLLIFKN